MNRLFKFSLLLVSHFPLKGKIHIYVEIRLFDFRRVQILPDWFYRPVFRVGMRMNNVSYLKKQANWLIHKIPYDVRFKLA
jgi:hypothetical protein